MTEIIANKEGFLEKNSDISSELNTLFDKLAKLVVLNDTGVVAYMAKEKCLYDINVLIVERAIGKTVKRLQNQL